MKMPNGYGSVVNLGKGRRKPYGARVTTGWTADGKQKVRYIGYFEDRAQALIALAEYNKDPGAAASRRTTLADAYAAWSKRKFDGMSYQSVKGYESAWAKVETLHDRDIKTISTDTMQTLIDSLEDRYSASTLKGVKRVLVECFGWAEQRDIVAKNYAEFIEIGKKSASDKHRPFTDAEVHRVLELADAGDEAARLVAIMLYTGVRISELTGQQTTLVDLDRRMMVGGTKTTAGKNRRIPLHERIVPFVAERMEDRFLVMNSRGTAAMHRGSFVNLLWEPLMEKIGAEHLPHDTRSTFVSKLDGLGANEVAVKMIVGHSFGGDVTKKAYTFKTDEELLAAVDMLDW